MVGASGAHRAIAVLLVVALVVAVEACGDEGVPSTDPPADVPGGTDGSPAPAGFGGSTGGVGGTASVGDDAGTGVTGVADDGTTSVDASAPDAAVPDPCTPAPFTPDPVTRGLALPTVVPLLRIDVGGATIEKDVEVPGTLEVFEDHDGTLTNLPAPTLTTPVAVQGRGNFTWSLPKKGFALELQDGAGNQVDLEVLGMPAGSDWALYACYTDKTCLRNALVFALAQELGRWSPRTRFVELEIDGDYRGLYMVLERIRRDVARVDLPKPAPDATLGDVTGGYIVRVEAGKGTVDIGGTTYDRDFTTTSGRLYTYHYPRVQNLTPGQSTYLQDYMQAFEDAMEADAAAFADWIDTTSWVDHGIVEEFTNNWDGYVHSIYMTKAPDSCGGALGMGPLWDYDLAFANGNVTGYNCMTDTWAYQITRPPPDDVPAYWLGLYADPAFQTAFKCRWQQLRAASLTRAVIDARIDAWVAFTASARARDQVRWPTIGSSIFPNCFDEPTYDAEVTALRDWIDARLTWLDAQVSALPGTCP